MNSRTYNQIDNELQDLYRLKMGASGKDAIIIERKIQRLIKEMEKL